LKTHSCSTQAKAEEDTGNSDGDPELGVNVSPDDSGEVSSEKIDAGEGILSAKPKRIRRVEEPKPKR